MNKERENSIADTKVETSTQKATSVVYLPQATVILQQEHRAVLEEGLVSHTTFTSKSICNLGEKESYSQTFQ